MPSSNMTSSSKLGHTLPSRSVRTWARTTRRSGRVGHLRGPAGQDETIVLPGRRAGLAVQRVAPVPAQVLPLGPGHDEQVQARVADDRADRVHPRAAVGPDRAQERQSDAELVELPAPGVGQGGCCRLKSVQVIIWRTLRWLSLTSCVSDSG